MHSRLSPSAAVLAATLLALAALPSVAVALGDSFLVAFVARVLVYAIAASALNLALGLGGLVSLGHALFIGIGMYSVALPVHHGLDSGWLHLGICVLACVLVAGLTGAVSLRTQGIGFIMITLAFAQMGYFVIVSLKQYGGDDGMGIGSPSRFFGWTLATPADTYYAAWFILVALLGWMVLLRRSPFGMTLRAGRQNPRRVAAAGLALQPYLLMAYVLSAVLCGIAGMLLANLNAYASPSSMSWMTSGELIVIVVLGGLGTVVGPALGAALFLGIEELLKAGTEHWMAVFGLMVLAVALFGRGGVMGWMARWRGLRAGQEGRA